MTGLSWYYRCFLTGIMLLYALSYLYQRVYKLLSAYTVQVCIHWNAHDRDPIGPKK
jgi:hypothetical protein